MISWPAELPQTFLYDGFSQETDDGRIMAETEVGPGKMRRRYSSVPVPISGQMHLTVAQKDRLQEFVRVDTRGGTLPFLFPKLQEAGTMKCRFGKNLPNYRPTRPGKKSGASKPLWRATIQLAVMP